MERKDRIDAFGGAVLLSFSLLMGLRSAFAFLPVLAFAILARRRLSLTDGSFWPGVLCGTFFAVEFMLLFQSVEYTSVARVSVFFYTMPFWVAAGAHFMIPGERLTRVRASGLVLAASGVVLALLRNESPAGEHALFGDLLALTGAMFWAGIVFLARLTKFSRSSAEMQLLYQLAVSAVILLAVAPLFGPVIREIGFLAWFWVLKIYPASDMASYSFLAPVFGVLFSWLILHEEISWSVIAALALVAAGIYLVNRRARPGA